MKKIADWVLGTGYLVGTVLCAVLFIRSKEWSALMWLGVAQIFLVDAVTLDLRYKKLLERVEKDYELIIRTIRETRTFLSKEIEDLNPTMNEGSEKKSTIQ